MEIIDGVNSSLALSALAKPRFPHASFSEELIR
jgi:hypothetical protein